MPYIFVTLFGIVGAVEREWHAINVLSIFVTLLGIAGAVVSLWQSQNVLSIFVTGFPAISERIVPYVVFEVSFTVTDHSVPYWFPLLYIYL